MPAGEAANDPRRLPAVAERAVPGVQPVDQQGTRRGLRPGDRARRAAPPGAAWAHAPGQLRREPRVEGPAFAGGGAADGPLRAGADVRADAARRANARRAEAADRAHATVRRPVRRARDARA